ncbi:DUF7284 family protein [Natrialba swarupiae]|uniref:Uncharacterized protein n=1 Tax=Natrialba swarupiae TaxID=2448032 RepID=A0A5D5AT99_9EURY|nr:hypothetical protein [Natrialba swarupiae]TYT62740.1 hypothetical protein FYC77_06835 [Natrialba swarupiae]
MSTDARRSDRAVSTVVDVSLCLLCITASIGIIAVFLAEDVDRHDPQIADETAQTIATSTTTVEYSIQSVERHDDTGVFDGAEYEADRYERARHGPLAQLLAAAAIANLHLDGERLSHAGGEFREAVDANLGSELIGANDDVHVLATWEPYEDASTRGETVAGDRPPGDADVSTATFTVASDLPPVREDELEGTYDAENRSFDETAEPIADAIVSGLFPNESTTIALQGNDLDRDLALYEYHRAGDALDVEYDPENGTLSRTDVNVSAANERLAENLTETIANDLERTYGDDIDEIEAELDATYPEDEEAVTDEVDDLVAPSVATDEVTITVRVWDE